MFLRLHYVIWKTKARNSSTSHVFRLCLDSTPGYHQPSAPSVKVEIDPDEEDKCRHNKYCSHGYPRQFVGCLSNWVPEALRHHAGGQFRYWPSPGLRAPPPFLQTMGLMVGIAALRGSASDATRKTNTSTAHWPRQSHPHRAELFPCYCVLKGSLKRLAAPAGPRNLPLSQRRCSLTRIADAKADRSAPSDLVELLRLNAETREPSEGCASPFPAVEARLVEAGGVEPPSEKSHD